MISPEEWRPADDLTLEPNALIAASSKAGSLALTAGPGAGKTEMLAQRADFLLQTGLCRYPRRILAISFKVDASRNLKERVKRRCGASLSNRFDSYTFHAFAKRIIDRFRPLLTGRDALNPEFTIGDVRIPLVQITFDDLMPLAIQILEASAMARNTIRQTYSDVFLDEFQDCTNRQYRLIKLAFKDTPIRLVAVGDTKQRIMAWAGALEGIFCAFAEDFEARPLNLYRNFRSLPRLLRMQNGIIGRMDPVAKMPEDMIRGDGGIISIKNFDDSQQEAESLGEQISSWINDEGVPPSDIAVLVSKQADIYAKPLMDELARRRIPFRNEQQLQELSAEPLTRIVADYLLVLFGDREPDAYARLIAQLSSWDGEEGWQFSQRVNWVRFIGCECQKLREAEPPVSDFKSSWAYAASFLRKIGKERLMSLSPDYESPLRLKEILCDIRKRLADLMATESDIVKALSLLTGKVGVAIMTIHKSKGLEFDSVVVLGVENETFWGEPENERCAFFVGISRAKRRLLLTCAGIRPRPDEFSGRWRDARSRHEEFLAYAEPFCE